MSISKSLGVTPTEKLLAELCDDTFLKLWAYPNPFKSDGKELCDIIAVFENHVFLFFDRESKKFENPDGDVQVQWARWEKEVIQKQIKTAAGAKRYILDNPDKVYLDTKCTIPFPVPIPKENLIVHKIIVAHGAAEACKNFSPENITGSLGINYSIPTESKPPFPFMVHLDKTDPLHVLDSYNLEIILRELDTVHDFTAYITAKENAIEKLMTLIYCGEEDLLGHYFSSFDDIHKKHFIGSNDKKVNGVFVEEGTWQEFIKNPAYKRRNEANKISEVWDQLLQRTCQNALDESITGNSNIFIGQSAIFEMAKEPRFSRRTLSELITRSINNFPGDGKVMMRNLSVIPSFYTDRTYVFLQFHEPDITDYENDHRPKRQKLLEIACGVTKNKFPHFKKILGIAIDAPKFTEINSEDFVLLNCDIWTDEDRLEFEELNKLFGFFESPNLSKKIITVNDFPKDDNTIKFAKAGRNELCPCGSGKKYKKCCMK